MSVIHKFDYFVSLNLFVKKNATSTQEYAIDHY